MSLTFGRSPFGPERGSYDTAPLPEQIAYVEPWPRRMRALLGDQAILDSRAGMMLHRTGQPPALLFPWPDVRADLLLPDTGPGVWSVRVGNKLAGRAVHRAPVLAGAAGAAVKDLVQLRHGAFDRWFEEDDPVYAHPRDPYHRVDVRSSSQHVLVRHEGVLVAESRRPKLLFETSAPIRYYLPFADVRIHLLQRSDTVSECPYKGDGQHWHLRGARSTVPDAAWSLPHPLPEEIPAHERICFYPDAVEVIVDGRRIDT